MNKKYLGKLVFMEKLNAAGNPEYNSGEYLCIAETESVLYCVRLGVGYDFYNRTNFALVGSAPWKVISITTDDALVTKLIKDNEAYCDNESTKPSKQWVESVYTAIKSNCAELRRNLSASNNSTTITKTIEVSKGTQVIINFN